jgi:hypothetical protein
MGHFPFVVIRIEITSPEPLHLKGLPRDRWLSYLHEGLETHGLDFPF